MDNVLRYNSLMILKPPFDELPNITTAVEMYKNGNSMLELQKKFNCSEQTVRIMLRFCGVRKKRVSNGAYISDETISTILTEYTKGASLNGLANRFSIDRSTIRHWVQKSGVTVGNVVPLGFRSRIKDSKFNPLKVVSKKKKPLQQKVGKYDHIVFEPINQGKSYDGYLKVEGLKVCVGGVYFTKKDLLHNTKKKPPK